VRNESNSPSYQENDGVEGIDDQDEDENDGLEIEHEIEEILEVKLPSNIDLN